MRNKLSLRREAQPHRGDAPLTPNGKPETFLASWVGDTIVANPGRACTNAAKPPLRPRFCTFSTSRPATFENVTVLHDTKPTFTFSNPRLLLQAALPPQEGSTPLNIIQHMPPIHRSTQHNNMTLFILLAPNYSSTHTLYNHFKCHQVT